MVFRWIFVRILFQKKKKCHFESTVFATRAPNLRKNSKIKWMNGSRKIDSMMNSVGSFAMVQLKWAEETWNLCTNCSTIVRTQWQFLAVRRARNVKQKLHSFKLNCLYKILEPIPRIIQQLYVRQMSENNGQYRDTWVWMYWSPHLRMRFFFSGNNYFQLIFKFNGNRRKIHVTLFEFSEMMFEMCQTLEFCL